MATAWGTLFPLSVTTWGANVRYSTDIIVGRNGQEVRNALWQDPLLSFNAAFSAREYADIATLVSFFHAMKGREQSFLVKDNADFQVETFTPFLETVDGVRTTFQLIKQYVNPVVGTYTRTITKPKQIEGAGGVTVAVTVPDTACVALACAAGIGSVAYVP